MALDDERRSKGRWRVTEHSRFSTGHTLNPSEPRLEASGRTIIRLNSPEASLVSGQQFIANQPVTWTLAEEVLQVLL